MFKYGPCSLSNVWPFLRTWREPTGLMRQWRFRRCVGLMAGPPVESRESAAPFLCVESQITYDEARRYPRWSSQSRPRNPPGLPRGPLLRLSVRLRRQTSDGPALCSQSADTGIGSRYTALLWDASRQSVRPDSEFQLPQHTRTTLQHCNCG